MNIITFLGILDRLEDAAIPYTLTRSREDALMITVATPGRLWEIEVSADGVIDVDEFIGGQNIREGLEAIDRMLTFWVD